MNTKGGKTMLDNTEIIKLYEEYLKDKGLKENTIKLYVSYARGFIKKKNKDITNIKDSLKPFIEFLKIKNLYQQNNQTEKSTSRIFSLIEEFLNFEKNTKRLKKESIKVNKSVLTKLANYLINNNVTEITQITDKMVNEYMVSRLIDGLKAESRDSALSIIKRFFKYLLERDIILHNPLMNIERPKVGERLPRDIPTVEEIDEILKHIDISTREGIRDYALIETLYGTGVRANEVINIQWKDVDFINGFVTIHDGKGGDDRRVPINKIALSWIDKIERKSDKVFNLPIHRVSRIIKRYVEKTTIKKHIIPHSFRYACATHMLKNGADIRFIQEMLGHKRLSTTQQYTRVVPKDLKRILRKFHPRG